MTDTDRELPRHHQGKLTMTSFIQALLNHVILPTPRTKVSKDLHDEIAAKSEMLRLLIKFTDGSEGIYDLPNFNQLNFYWQNIESRPIDSVSLVALEEK